MPVVSIMLGGLALVTAALAVWAYLITQNPRRWRYKWERGHGILLDDVVPDPQRFHRRVRIFQGINCVVFSLATVVLSCGAVLMMDVKYKTLEQKRQEQQQWQERWERESQEAHKSFAEKFGKPLGDSDARKPPKE